jgi:hypothetical protein
MTSPNLNFITDQSQILKCLTESLHRGTVVGITSQSAGHTMFLTAVENIFNSAVNGEKMISFKKFDISGAMHDKHCLPLKDIDRVQSYQALYKDSIRKAFRKIVSTNETNQKVRCLESFISAQDLKIILIKLLDTNQKVTITVSGKAHEAMEVYVKDIDARFEKISVASSLSSQTSKEIKIVHIENVQFETYYNFKGSSSKIFQVQEASLKLSKAQ